MRVSNNIKCRGIVLKEINSGESSKNIIILSKRYGKIIVYVKGGKNYKSKYLAGSQIFAYCDFVLYKGKNFYSITEVSILDNFYKLTTDYTRLCYGSYFLELCEKTIQVDLECDKILLLLIRSLKQLEKGIHTPKTIMIVFEMLFLKYSGYGLDIYNCSICLNEIEQLKYINSSGGICDRCSSKELKKIKVSLGAYKTFKYVLNTEINTIFSFKISKNIVDEISKINDIFIKEHFNLECKSKKRLD